MTKEEGAFILLHSQGLHFCSGLVGDLLYFGHVYSLSLARYECTRQTRRVKKVQVHPCYCGDSFGCANNIHQWQFDIAVLTLDAPLNFNEFVQPICLPGIVVVVVVVVVDVIGGGGGGGLTKSVTFC